MFVNKDLSETSSLVCIWIATNKTMFFFYYIDILVFGIGALNDLTHFNGAL